MSQENSKMAEKSDNSFGDYLRNLRESREMSARMVEDKVHRLYPDDNKHYHISQGHLTQIERGEKPPPFPLKLKALAKVYGENYEIMLYKAGYLDKNPATEPNEWSQQTIRDLYFDEFMRLRKKRGLTEAEKLSLEKVIENVIETLVKG